MPYLWLLVFFLAPFAIILKISLADPVIAQPPFTPTFDEQGNVSATSADNFTFLLTDKLYAITYLTSVVHGRRRHAAVPGAGFSDGLRHRALGRRRRAACCCC